jgi:hypothetical protein
MGRLTHNLPTGKMQRHDAPHAEHPYSDVTLRALYAYVGAAPRDRAHLSAV